MSYLDDLFGVAGKTALVTGGATGIGRMIAEGLAGGGARVLIASRKGEACVKVAKQINAMGLPGTVEGFGGDVGSAEGIEALAAEAAERTDALPILVGKFVQRGAPGDAGVVDEAWQKVFN
ncbi:MAG: SDR family NAD(P)-dependent oxidoreductase, partial [Pseudomonadota bacterium]